MKAAKPLFLALLLVASFCSVNVLPLMASDFIYIKADGSVEGTNKIYREGNVYKFTGDIKDSYGIIVEKGDIVVDGAGHTLQGTYRILPIGSWDYGIELSNVSRGNVTIKNLKIKEFNIGIFVWTADNTITGNVIVDAEVAVFLAESPNTVVDNYIENNGDGIFLGPISLGHDTSPNIICHNSFVDNTRQVYDCECTDSSTIQQPNIWNNGTHGNYWSNYNGTDNNADGIGDIPYPVSDDDFDTCPIMNPIEHPLTEQHGFLGTNLPVEQGLLLVVAIVVAIIAITGYLLFKRSRRPDTANQNRVSRVLFVFSGGCYI